MKQVKIGVGFGLWRLGMPPAETIARVAERALGLVPNTRLAARINEK